MTQQHEVLHSTKYRQRIMWLAEREKLLSNLENLHQTCEQLTAKKRELSELLEKVQSNLADARSLQLKLNSTAVQLNLALISPRKTRR